MTDRSGLYKGRHYTTYVEEVKALKRAGDYVGAERLLLALVGAAENEARANRWRVAPGYYNQLAIIYRKTKQPDKELQILERYAGCWRPEDGPLPADTVSAIEKARQRAGKADAAPLPPAGSSTRPVLRPATICESCGFEHQALTRCPRCGSLVRLFSNIRSIVLDAIAFARNLCRSRSASPQRTFSVLALSEHVNNFGTLASCI